MTENPIHGWHFLSLEVKAKPSSLCPRMNLDPNQIENSLINGLDSMDVVEQVIASICGYLELYSVMTIGMPFSSESSSSRCYSMINRAHGDNDPRQNFLFCLFQDGWAGKVPCNQHNTSELGHVTRQSLRCAIESSSIEECLLLYGLPSRIWRSIEAHLTHLEVWEGR